jgi:hypothetical protein
LEMVPTFGVTDQVTPVFAVPVTIAVNCADWPAVNVVAPCSIEMFTGEGAGVVVTGWVSSAVAVAVLVVSARLVAEIVTWVSLENEAGAV